MYIFNAKSRLLYNKLSILVLREESKLPNSCAYLGAYHTSSCVCLFKSAYFLKWTSCWLQLLSLLKLRNSSAFPGCGMLPILIKLLNMSPFLLSYLPRRRLAPSYSRPWTRLESCSGIYPLEIFTDRPTEDLARTPCRPIRRSGSSPIPLLSRNSPPEIIINTMVRIFLKSKFEFGWCFELEFELWMDEYMLILLILKWFYFSGWLQLVSCFSSVLFVKGQRPFFSSIPAHSRR